MRSKSTIAAAAWPFVAALAVAGSRRRVGHAAAGDQVGGHIVFCTDATYPPEESIPTGSTNPIGSDIDIANDVAAQMGVKAQFKNTGFDGDHRRAARRRSATPSSAA